MKERSGRIKLVVSKKFFVYEFNSESKMLEERGVWSIVREQDLTFRY